MARAEKSWLNYLEGKEVGEPCIVPPMTYTPLAFVFFFKNSYIHQLTDGQKAIFLRKKLTTVA